KLAIQSLYCLSLHDALPICATLLGRRGQWFGAVTIGLAAITLALSLWFLWGDPYADPFSTSFTDVLYQVLYSLIVVTAVASVCSHRKSTRLNFSQVSHSFAV